MRQRCLPLSRLDTALAEVLRVRLDVVLARSHVAGGERVCRALRADGRADQYDHRAQRIVGVGAVLGWRWTARPLAELSSEARALGAARRVSVAASKGGLMG